MVDSIVRRLVRISCNEGVFTDVFVAVGSSEVLIYEFLSALLYFGVYLFFESHELLIDFLHLRMLITAHFMCKRVPHNNRRVASTSILMQMPLVLLPTLKL